MGVLRHTIIYKYWSEMCGVTWKDEEKVLAGLRYREYSCGNRTTLLYIQKERWSKWYRDKKVNGEALGLSYLKGAAEFLKRKGGRWLCVPNLDFEAET